MRRLPGVLLAGALLVTVAVPASAQDEAGWQNMWFWGVHSSVGAYKTATSGGTEFHVGVGGHWFITGKRAGLYLAYDQLFYPNGPASPANGRIADFTSATGFRDVQWDQGRYIKADLIAIPLRGYFQVLAGAGVLIHQISDPVALGTFASPADQDFSQFLVEEAATRAFWNLMVGFQLRLGSQLALAGTYEFIPSARDFLITAEQHVLTGYLRVALGSRREDVGGVR